jgi:hypothetical protein
MGKNRVPLCGTPTSSSCSTFFQVMAMALPFLAQMAVEGGEEEHFHGVYWEL